MRWAQLPPVGEPILVARSSEVPGFGPAHKVHYVDSGTSALALAIRSAAAAHGTARPEVVIPGYCCPDLVAACVSAGASAVLVDLEPDTPWLSLEGVQRACTPDTVAVLAVNFLGVRERLAQLGTIARQSGCVLIEDCAQWFPEENTELPADYTVLSFGKGKPVSLLGGGALISREQPVLPFTPAASPESGLLRAKIAAYNLLTRPALYGALIRLPGTGIGATRFHAHGVVLGMTDARRELLSANVQAYRRRQQRPQQLLREGLNRLPRGIVDLGALPGAGRLLRYPLLMPDAELALRAEAMLLEQGLGASRMYRQALGHIEGVPLDRLRLSGEQSVAENFAGRLLTLPVHSRVKDRHVEAITAVLHEALQGEAPNLSSAQPGTPA